MEIARIVLSIIVGLLLLVTGGGKVLDLSFSRGNRDSLSVHPVFWRITGILEVAATVGLIWGIWFVPFGLAAAIGVVLLMLGAIGFRIRTRDKKIIQQSVADVVILLIAAAIILLSVLALK
jgi:DoxX-like family